MYLCTCNNCGGVFEDTNPGSDSIEYPDFGYHEFDVPPLENHECPVCKCNNYLVDNVNEGAANPTIITDLHYATMNLMNNKL